MPFQRLLLAICLILPAAVPMAAQISSPTISAPSDKAVTVADAQAFMDRAEADLSALSIEGAHAGWVQETYITDDTEAISAKAGERILNRTNELVIESRKYANLQLPPDLARKFMLLRLNAAPTDPKLVAELTQTAAALDGMYGKGKYCRVIATDTVASAADAFDSSQSGKSTGKQCLGIEEIDFLMAKSRDPKELLDLWQGWHSIAPAMRDKYARLIALSN